MRGVFGEDREYHENEVKIGIVVIPLVLLVFAACWILYSCGG